MRYQSSSLDLARRLTKVILLTTLVLCSASVGCGTSRVQPTREQMVDAIRGSLINIEDTTEFVSISINSDSSCVATLFSPNGFHKAKDDDVSLDEVVVGSIKELIAAHSPGRQIGISQKAPTRRRYHRDGFLFQESHFYASEGEYVFVIKTKHI
jgi:hypothetical protein